MDQLIVYGSQYGTTQRYAERFSELTRLPCIRSEAVKDLSLSMAGSSTSAACTPAGSRACEGPSGPWGSTPGWSSSPWGWRM